MTTEPQPTYGWPTMRVLHSVLVDYLCATREPVRDAILDVLGGLDFPHFLVAVCRHRTAVITTRQDVATGYMIGLRVQCAAGDLLIREVTARHCGMTDGDVLAWNLATLDQQLKGLLHG